MLRHNFMNQVEYKDADCNPSESVSTGAEEISSSLSIMLLQERRAYTCGDYIYGKITNRIPLTQYESVCVRKSQKMVNESCREQICEWCYRVIEFFHFDREVVYIAMSYLDRLLMSCLVDRQTYRLAAATSLLLALKVHHPKKIVLADFVSDLSKGVFSTGNLFQMEMIMLRVLSWRIHPPTPMSYIVRILMLNPFGSQPVSGFDVNSVQDFAIFFAELSVRDYHFVTLGQSVIALSSILNAIDGLRLWNASEMMGCQGSKPICRYVSKICNLLDIGYDDELVTNARQQLWHLYERSEKHISKISLKHNLVDSFRVPRKFSSEFPLNEKKKLTSSPRVVSTQLNRS